MFAPRCIALLASTTQLPPVAAGNFAFGFGKPANRPRVRGAASRRSATVTPPDGRANKRKPAEGATRHELLRCFKRGLPEVNTALYSKTQATSKNCRSSRPESHVAYIPSRAKPPPRARHRHRRVARMRPGLRAA